MGGFVGGEPGLRAGVGDSGRIDRQPENGLIIILTGVLLLFFRCFHGLRNAWILLISVSWLLALFSVVGNVCIYCKKKKKKIILLFKVISRVHRISMRLPLICQIPDL